jgi:uncharacterized membrane protein YdbT with pleckstrin-like domain
MVEILQKVALTMWTAGGQGRARRNAWVSMVADSQQAKARSEANEALDAALDRFLRDESEPARAHG